MRKSLFQAAAVATMLVAVAMLASVKDANADVNADVVGIGMGYRLDPSRITIDFLPPLQLLGLGGKPSQASVRNAELRARRANVRAGAPSSGLRVGGRGSKQGGLYSRRWISVTVPFAYEYIFHSGFSVIAGTELRYENYKKITLQQPDAPEDNFVAEKKLGGGIVLGSNYFFQSGLFLGMRISAGALRYEEIYEEEGSRSGIYGYAEPALFVGYMF